MGLLNWLAGQPASEQVRQLAPKHEAMEREKADFQRIIDGCHKVMVDCSNEIGNIQTRYNAAKAEYDKFFKLREQLASGWRAIANDYKAAKKVSEEERRAAQRAAEKAVRQKRAAENAARKEHAKIVADAKQQLESNTAQVS